MMSCLVHVRRGFKKADKYDKKLVVEVLTLFNVIYRIEAYDDKVKLLRISDYNIVRNILSSSWTKSNPGFLNSKISIIRQERLS